MTKTPNLSPVSFFPPEIIPAENGYVIRTYDAASDHTRYRIAKDAGEVRAALYDWVNETTTAIQHIAADKGRIALNNPIHSDAPQIIWKD